MAPTELRFVHAADLHLDSPFTSLRTTVPPHVADDLCDATFKTFGKIVRLCLDENVDALLISGDVYDAADKSLRAQLRFAEGMQALAEEGIRSFVCHGNHDPLDGWEARLDWPDQCTRFGPDLSSAPIFKDDPQRAMVHGVSYRTRETKVNLSRLFKDLPKSQYDIGLLHTNVGGDADHGAYAPCTMADLQGTPIDYWALGHVHTRQLLSTQDPVAAYPGNTQGRSANETGERGVFLVEVDAEGVSELEFRAMDSIRWLRIEVDIGKAGTMGRVIDAILQQLETVLGQTNRPCVVQLTLKGRGPMNAELRSPGQVNELLDELNDSWIEENPWIWCDRLQIATQSPIDRKAALRREDFVGDLARLAAEMRETEELTDEIEQTLDPLFDSNRRRRFLHHLRPQAAELRRLLLDAEEECLAKLTADPESS